MSVKRRMWWHGTTSAAKARAILREGFRKGSYFARNLEDALEFGGRHVIMAQFYCDLRRGGPSRNWQVCLSNALPADAIVSYEVYSIKHVAGDKTGVFNAIEHPEKSVRRIAGGRSRNH